jgi:voltage-gated potassium channel Kch
MSLFAKPVVQQRRFKYLLAGLVGLSLMLGLLVVPFERNDQSARIHTWFDGIWWSTITVTGVGYGDMVPVTPIGRIIGMVLAVVGVLSFGLLIGIFSLALDETKDKYYRKKLFEQLDMMEHKIDRLEKHNDFVMKKENE